MKLVVYDILGNEVVKLKDEFQQSGKFRINWDGKIFLRDSPHGPRLKFALTISVNGPREVELSQINF